MSDQKAKSKSGRVSRTSRLAGSVSDFAAQWIAEGFAYGCLCIAVAWSGAYFMWWLVVLWAFCLGPSKKESNDKRDFRGVAD